MKISIKSESTKEVEFPVPSFWDEYGVKHMVTEDVIVWVGNEVLCVDKNGSDSYSRHINDLLNKGTEIREEDFYEAYAKTLHKISDAVQLPETV